MRLINAVVGCAAALAPVAGWTLGLGPLEQRSALNEPFIGRIEIVDARSVDFDSLTIGLASAERHARAGVNLGNAALALDFRVRRGVGGRDYVEISTEDPLREPVLNFLVQAVWENGQLFREYTALLDPPMYDPSRGRATQVAAAAGGAPEPRPAGAPGRYGPVAAGETLYGIAEQTRGGGVSVNQMMIALFDANPTAFIGNNINALRQGVILDVPAPGDAAALSEADARARVQGQMESWRGAAATGATQPRIEAAAPAAAPAPEPAGEASRLRLVAPGAGEDAAGVQGVGGTASGGSELLQEELDARRQESADLAAKLTEANEIIDLLQRQIEIKDSELARLQARLAELDAGAMPEAPGEPAAAGAAPEPEDEFADLLALPEDEAGVAATDETMAEPEPMAEPMPEPAADTMEPAPEDTMEGPAPADVAAPPPVEPATPPAPVVAAPPAAGPLGGLIPEGVIPDAVVDAVPGGLRTLLAAAGAVLLGLILLVLRAVRGRRGEKVVATAAPATAEPPAAPESTISSAMDTVTDFEADATLDAGPDDAAATTPDLESTIATTTEQTLGDTLVDVEPDVDPLEEVNVYLAYERFDQAEELVRDAIKKHPEEHQYKLRLLEVFYSANDKLKYEEAARELHDAVGENDPLWESAVAMWNEMSPNRALFGEGAGMNDTMAATRSGAKAFVDLSGESDSGSDTMSIGPGSPEALERTQVGDADDVGDDDSGVLDITGSGGRAEAPEDDDIFDLTATTDAPSADDMIDLTSTGDLEQAMKSESEEDVFDISGESAAEEADVFNVTSAEDNDIFDITSSHGHADLSGDESRPSPLDEDETVTEEKGTGTTAPDEDNVIEFDLSDTVQPPLQQTMAGTDVVLDDDDELEGTMDFDVTDLGEGRDVEAPQTEPSEDLAIDLSDTHGDESIDEPSTAEPGDLDFDFSIGETSELGSMEVEDTLELPKEHVDTLADLERSLESSLDDLDKESPLESTSDDLDTNADLDLSLDFGEEGEAPAQGAGPPADSGEPAELALDEDDYDTKLNLAKAYVELGDHDGARAILSEVREGGSPEQKEQAKDLLGELG